MGKLIDYLPIIIQESNYFGLNQDLYYENEERAAIHVRDTDKVIIDGRGKILSAKNFTVALLVENCKNVFVKDLMIIYDNPKNFSFCGCYFINCQNLFIENLCVKSADSICFFDNRGIKMKDIDICGNLGCTLVFRNTFKVYLENMRFQNGFVDCKNMSIMECFHILREAKRNNIEIRW